MTFLFDNNFSPRLVVMLRALEVDAIALREHFPHDIQDVELFPYLHGSGWIFVTSDTRIQRRAAEAQALKECGVSAVFFRPFLIRKTMWEQANWLTKHWQAVEKYVVSLDPPIYVEVESNGKLHRLSL